MKLYIYDHCPFCVRARMMVGLRQQNIELVYLLNDDEDTPIRMIGAKQVPILQKEDGSYMGESLDIVRYIDQNQLDEQIRPEIQAWFDAFGAWGNRLIMPRDVQLDLPEFATPAAIDYFVQKKQASLGETFAQMQQNTAHYLAQAHQALQTLSSYLPEQPVYLNGTHLSMEDIIIFPLLRNLSMVKGVQYPDNVAHYLHSMAQASQVPLYFDRAI